MLKFRFFQTDWTPDDKLIEWTKGKGLSDKQIADQLERIKDHEYIPMRSSHDRCWRRWIRNALDWGRIVPSITPQYKGLEVVSDEQLRKDAEKSIIEMANYRRGK